MLSNQGELLQRLYAAWTKIISGANKRLKWLVYLFVMLAFVYLLAILIYSGQEIRQIPFRSWGAASLLVMLIYLVSLLIQSLVWARMLSSYGKINWEDILIYFKVLVLRRLPGGILHWFGRAAMYAGSNQLPAKTVMLANFSEWAILVILAGALSIGGFSVLPWYARITGFTALFALGVYIGYLWQPATKPRTTKVGESFIWAALYTCSWALGGVVLYLFSRAVGSIEPGLLESIWIWAVTGGSTTLLLIVPAGLGIREVALVFLLQPFMPAPMALIVALLIRFTFTLSDILWGLLGWGLSYWVLEKHKRAEAGPG